MADDMPRSLAPEERARLAELLAPLLAPSEHQVQEVRPGVYVHTWRFKPEQDEREERVSDGDDRATER